MLHYGDVTFVVTWDASIDFNGHTDAAIEVYECISCLSCADVTEVKVPCFHQHTENIFQKCYFYTEKKMSILAVCAPYVVHR